MTLRRFLDRQAGLLRRSLAPLLAEGRVQVDGVGVHDGQQEITRFQRILADDQELQAGSRALYLMLHKPAGYVSATVDAEHPTVLDLIDDPDAASLHLAGRLDRATTGLVLLTNDGKWSKRITLAEHHVPKVYLVETATDLDPSDVVAFATGFYFHTEDITTRPATLEILSARTARLTLREGRYHQVKRMFHRVQKRVVALHRERIGGITLDVPLGQWRALAPTEISL